MRCPLCDGPVVNGRCKDCGMPYRKDEILYHLNESRSDHYKHASDKARKIMREQQRPQDTPKRMNGAAKSTAGRTTVSRQAIQEQQGSQQDSTIAALRGTIYDRNQNVLARSEREIHQKAEETFEICVGMDTVYSCDVTCTGIWRF